MTVKRRGGISKFTVPGPSTLAPHTFLHWIKTSGVKIRSALKTWKADIAELIINCENNYSR